MLDALCGRTKSMASSILRRLSSARRSAKFLRPIGPQQQSFACSGGFLFSLGACVDSFQVSLLACVDSFQLALPAFIDRFQPSLSGTSRCETFAESEPRFRTADDRRCEGVSVEALKRFLAVKDQIGRVALAEAGQRCLFVKGRSFGVPSKEFFAEAFFPRKVAKPGLSAVVLRNGFFVPRLFCDRWTCGESCDGGCSRLPGVMLHSRGYAAKSKKAKSKIEDVSDLVEDVGVTAKENAVKMMEDALDVLVKEHSKLRTGRASSGMLDHITVEAHGVRTPLSHIAAVTVSGLQTLSVLPYDASIVKEVEKSILNSPLGLNPQVDGATITVPLPRLTKEHCATMCKIASKAGESAKLTIRRARKEALDSAKKSGSFSKDEIKRFEKEVEELTKKYSKSIEETCKKKEKEIMS